MPSELPEAAPRTKLNVATPTERDFTARSARVADEHAALRAPGRVIVLSCDGGVRLLEWHDGAQVVAEFDSTGRALAAVRTRSIAWRLVRRKAAA